MAKQGKSSSSEQQISSESQLSSKSKKSRKNTEKRKTKGRPKLTNNKATQSNPDQPEFWFQSEMANKIVRLLGTKGQIIFKCLSGQKACKFKNQLDDNIISFDHFKNARQDYLSALNEWKEQLLDKLGYKQENNESKPKQYLFLGENKSGEEFNFSEHKELDLLKGYIDPEFFTTFKEIVEKTKNEEEMAKLMTQNCEKYKMINRWAIFKVLSKPYQEQLEKLQVTDNEFSSRDETSEQDRKDKFNENIREFLETADQKKIELKQQINEFQVTEELKLEMTEVIKELVSDIQEIIIKQ